MRYRALANFRLAAARGLSAVCAVACPNQIIEVERSEIGGEIPIYRLSLRCYQTVYATLYFKNLCLKTKAMNWRRLF